MLRFVCDDAIFDLGFDLPGPSSESPKIIAPEGDLAATEVTPRPIVTSDPDAIKAATQVVTDDGDVDK